MGLPTLLAEIQPCRFIPSCQEGPERDIPGVHSTVNEPAPSCQCGVCTKLLISIGVQVGQTADSELVVEGKLPPKAAADIAQGK